MPRTSLTLSSIDTPSGACQLLVDNCLFSSHEDAGDNLWMHNLHVINLNGTETDTQPPMVLWAPYLTPEARLWATNVILQGASSWWVWKATAFIAGMVQYHGMAGKALLPRAVNAA